MLAQMNIEDNVLKGAQLNDQDDEEQTLQSIKAAETITGGKMATPEQSKQNLNQTGNKIENVMASNGRISSEILNDALLDKDAEDRIRNQRLEAERKENEARKAKQQKKVKQEEEELAVHFASEEEW